MSLFASLKKLCVGAQIRTRQSVRFGRLSGEGMRVDVQEFGLLSCGFDAELLQSEWAEYVQPGNAG